MTPTLFGRWQTRTLLLLTVGLVVTLFYALVAGLLFQDALTFLGGFVRPFAILFFVLLVGFFWDILYTLLQRFRWDRDWPPAFVFFAGVAEIIPAWLFGLLLGVPTWFFLLHYWSVWLAVFIFSFGPMRIFFIRWRFRGGQWL